MGDMNPVPAQNRMNKKNYDGRLGHLMAKPSPVMQEIGDKEAIQDILSRGYYVADEDAWKHPQLYIAFKCDMGNSPESKTIGMIASRMSQIRYYIEDCIRNETARYGHGQPSHSIKAQLNCLRADWFGGMEKTEMNQNLRGVQMGITVGGSLFDQSN